ncbi:MAG: Holliday junction branch migration protein RuvA [Rickettsiales bacterium]
MIGKLRGHIDDIEEDSVILDVNGVGYHLFCSSRTIAALPPVGEPAQLVTEMIVREDIMQLYGFPDKVEREWFRLLTTVQRVGNKVALVILGHYTPEQLAHAILAKDTTAFSRVKGIGAGLAERIVTELKDKVTKLPTSEFSAPATPPSKGKKKKGKAKEEPKTSHTDDAISALVNLGYSRSEAYSAALKASQNGAGSNLDELIKLSLKELVRG